MRLINRCLNKQLLEICQRSMQHDKLSEQVTLFLPPELRSYCRMGSFDKGTLILIADNASWATQLRFMLPELRDKLRSVAKIHGLRQIKINMAAPEFAQNTPQTKQSPTKNNQPHAMHYEPLRLALEKLMPST